MTIELIHDSHKATDLASRIQRIAYDRSARGLPWHFRLQVLVPDRRSKKYLGWPGQSRGVTVPTLADGELLLEVIGEALNKAEEVGADRVLTAIRQLA